MSLLSLGCCTCDGPKVQSPFAPSAQETFTRIGLTLRVKTFTRLVSTKRKGRKSYRRSSDLPSPRWGTSHLRDIRHGRASLVTLKRKDRMSYRRYRNLHTTCCILQHLQQSCCRTLRLVPLKRKGRMSYRRSRNLRTFHRHLVVAQALLCRCGVSHLISYALKRKGRKSYRRSCGACLTKSAHPPFSLVGSVQSRRPPGSSTQLFHTLHSGYGFFPCLRWGFGPSVWFCCCGSLRCCRPSGFPGLFVRGGRFGWRFWCGFYSSGCCKEHGL